MQVDFFWLSENNQKQRQNRKRKKEPDGCICQNHHCFIARAFNTIIAQLKGRSPVWGIETRRCLDGYHV